MLVKYCPSCDGRPYTSNTKMKVCPNCGKALQTEFVADGNLADREMLIDVDDVDDSLVASNRGTQDLVDISDKDNGIENPVIPVPEDNKFNNDNRIVGKVHNYSSTGNEDGTYRRFFITKLIDAIVFKQRYEDVLHRFMVRVDNGGSYGYSNYTDVPVNVHGTIAGGMQISDNTDVEVVGKYKNGVLMAEDIYIINGGYKSRVSFQRNLSSLVYIFFSLLALGALVYYGITANGTFTENLQYLLIRWAVVFVVLSVLYFVFILSRLGVAIRISSGKRMGFPIFRILIFSLAIALAFIYALGSTVVKTAISGALSTVLTVAIVIVLIIFIIKIIF